MPMHASMKPFTYLGQRTGILEERLRERQFDKNSVTSTVERYSKALSDFVDYLFFSCVTVSFSDHMRLSLQAK